MRVATWNLHGFKGRGRRPDPERSLRVVRALGADIVALQEVDGRARLGRLPHPFETLRDGLGGHLAEARLFGAPGRDYGQALWSRWPILRAEVRMLPGPGFEPRAAIDARIETPDGPVRVIAAHFGLGMRARRNQAGDLAAIVRAGEPTVLMGDLNEWHPAGTVDRLLRAALPAVLQAPTFPARWPVARLDRIYASAGAELRRIDAPVEAALASDHRPLVAELRMPRAAGE